MQELDVIFQLIVDSYNFVTGRTVSAADITAAAKVDLTETKTRSK